MSKQIPNFFFVISLIAYLSLFLDQFPKVYIDEPWESITAYQLSQNGILNNPVLAGRDFQDLHFLQPRILQSLVTSVFFHIFGLSLFSGRLVTLLLGIGTLWFFYRLLTFEKTSKYLVLYGILVLVTNYLFFTFSRTIRPEMFVTFIGFLSFYFLYVGVVCNQTHRFALCGFLSGIGMWTHPSYMIFMIGFGLLLVVEYRWNLFFSKNSWILVLFSIIGLLPYLIYLFIEDWENGLAHFWMQIKIGAKQDDEGFWMNTLSYELIRYKQYLSPYRGLVVMVEVFFLILSFRLKDRLSKYAKVIIITHIFLLPILIVNNRNARYFLPAIPFLIILIVKVIESMNWGGVKQFITDIRNKSFFQRTVFVLAAFLLFFQCLANPVGMIVARPSDYNQFLKNVRTHIPSNSRVWGSMMFWFGFWDCDYRTQYTYGKDLDSFQPEYIITHDMILWSRKNKRWDQLREQIESYVKKNCILIGEINDKSYGNIKIWKTQIKP